MPETHSEAEAAKASEIGSGGYPADPLSDGDCLADSGGYPASPAGDSTSFHTSAARVSMKLMYAARMARPDLLRSIAYLARYLTKWDDSCDKRLSKLMAYVQNTVSYRMYALSDVDRGEAPPQLRV